MKIKRFAFGLLSSTLLACNFVMQMITPPTPLPTATFTPSLTPTPTPLVPAYIPPQCAGQPFATVPPEQAALPTAELTANPDISKSEQLRVLKRIGEIVRAVYVYPDFNGKDWNEIEARYTAKVEAGLDTESFYHEMQAMIEELGDEHSYLLSPLEVKEDEAALRGQSEFVGIGIYAQPDLETGRMIVISTFPGSPAEHAGIKPHDTILLADGLPPVVNEMHNRVRGPECSAVILKVQSPGEAPRDLMLIRSTIRGGLTIDARLVPTSDGSKIGYLFIPTFFDETIPPQIEAALNEFGPLDGLILDVRLNGGGSSSVVEPIMAHFLNGRVGRFVSRSTSRVMTIEPNPIHNSQTVPLIVIVSEDTASFGEIFAGVLRDARQAKIVGETSLGNVEVLNGYNLPDGSMLWIAAETFDSDFSDDNWEETGIVPDVHAFAEWNTFYFETDPSLAAALELLGHK
ncbi:MAG TPA: S41 family peptidase [Anaerolineales bacterium]|nr:S41 family peptidase [Anaerolineales bacterium]